MSHTIEKIRITQKSGRPQKGHFVDTAETEKFTGSIKSGSIAETLSYCTMPCRLLDLEKAAAYIGVSSWTIRDLEAAGLLRRVRVPLPDGRDLRKLLFDKADLDCLIELWKTSVA